MNFDFQDQSPIYDLVPDHKTSVVLQPIIDSLEQILIESSNVSEPNIMRHIGHNIKSVPCQMAIINLCQKTIEASTVDTIIAEEASSTKYFLHEIGTRVLIRCIELSAVNVILQIARSMVSEGLDSTICVSTATKSLNIAKQHFVQKVSDYLFIGELDSH